MPVTIDSFHNWYLSHYYGKLRSLFEYYVSPYVLSDESRSSIHEIVPRIYLGDIRVAHNKEKLDSLGITHVVIAVVGVPPPFPDDYKYMNVDLCDVQEEDIKKHFSDVHSFIDDALRTPENKVLIHCMKGASRSATLVASYIMRVNDVPLQEAIQSMKEKRPVVNPNVGFMEQLEKYDMGLRATKSCLF